MGAVMSAVRKEVLPESSGTLVKNPDLSSTPPSKVLFLVSLRKLGEDSGKVLRSLSLGPQASHKAPEQQHLPEHKQTLRKGRNWCSYESSIRKNLRPTLSWKGISVLVQLPE